MPWQGIALSTELLPRQNEFNWKLVLNPFSVNAKLKTMGKKSLTFKSVLKKITNKWSFILILSLAVYFLGFFYGLDQYQPQFYRNIKSQSFASLLN